VRDPAYVKASGYLNDIDQFDAAFFGISLAMPPSSIRSTAVWRWLLECFMRRRFEDAAGVT